MATDRSPMFATRIVNALCTRFAVASSTQARWSRLLSARIADRRSRRLESRTQEPLMESLERRLEIGGIRSKMHRERTIRSPRIWILPRTAHNLAYLYWSPRIKFLRYVLAFPRVHARSLVPREDGGKERKRRGEVIFVIARSQRVSSFLFLTEKWGHRVFCWFLRCFVFVNNDYGLKEMILLLSVI